MSSEQKGSSISCSFLLSPDTISESLPVQDPTQTLPTDRNQLWRLTHLPLSLGFPPELSPSLDPRHPFPRVSRPVAKKSEVLGSLLDTGYPQIVPLPSGSWSCLGDPWSSLVLYHSLVRSHNPLSIASSGMGTSLPRRQLMPLHNDLHWSAKRSAHLQWRSLCLTSSSTGTSSSSMPISSPLPTSIFQVAWGWLPGAP